MSGKGRERVDGTGGEGAHPLVRDILLDPSRWRLWPVIAVLRWLLRRTTTRSPRIVYRSRPALGFTAAEVHEVVIGSTRIEVMLAAPGIAAAGSGLPVADIARIMDDARHGGGMAAWLDGPGDRFMHAVERAQARNNAAFALATGGRIEALAVVAWLAGASAPLAADAAGGLAPAGDGDPIGAVGLAGLFVGTPSAAGLEALVEAVTGLPARVREFACATVETLEPARMGAPMRRILGRRCKVASAGVEIVVEGGERPEAVAWARDATRRAAARDAVAAYVGSPGPETRWTLELESGNVPRAALDGQAVLGAIAVLGKPSTTTRIALRA